MTYLLDVNVLIAFGFDGHDFHQRVTDWLAGLHDEDQLATSAITELGFVRILPRVSLSCISVEEARSYLRGLKNTRVRPWVFIVDDHGLEHLPEWVKSGAQTTDGHLVELARAHDAIFATLDEKIPGALLIPGK